jgi:hypothetical protein
MPRPRLQAGPLGGPYRRELDIVEREAAGPPRRRDPHATPPAHIRIGPEPVLAAHAPSPLQRAPLPGKRRFSSPL